MVKCRMTWNKSKLGLCAEYIPFMGIVFPASAIEYCTVSCDHVFDKTESCNDVVRSVAAGASTCESLCGSAWRMTQSAYLSSIISLLRGRSIIAVNYSEMNVFVQTQEYLFLMRFNCEQFCCNWKRSETILILKIFDWPFTFSPTNRLQTSFIQRKSRAKQKKNQQICINYHWTSA